MKYNLATLTWSAAGNVIAPLSTLPPNHRLRSIRLLCALSGTKDSADTVPNTSFCSQIAQVKLGARHLLTGIMLQQMQDIDNGRLTGLGTTIPGSGITWSVVFELTLDLRQKRQEGSEDGSINVAELVDKSLEVQFAAANIFGVGNCVTTAGSIIPEVDLVPGSSVPEYVEQGYFLPGGQTIKLDPGVYLDLFVSDGVAIGSVAPAEVTQADLIADGEIVFNNRTYNQMISAYNHDNVLDAAAELGYATPNRLPIAHLPLRHGKMTKALIVEKTGELRLSGTLTAPCVVYRRIALKDQGHVDAALARTPAPDGATSYEPAVASKTAVRAVHQSARQGAPNKRARIAFAALPGKLRTTKTPGSL
jgi:hypothetical protein